MLHTVLRVGSHRACISVQHAMPLHARCRPRGAWAPVLDPGCASHDVCCAGALRGSVHCRAVDNSALAGRVDGCGAQRGRPQPRQPEQPGRRQPALGGAVKPPLLSLVPKCDGHAHIVLLYHVVGMCLGVCRSALVQSPVARWAP